MASKKVSVPAEPLARYECALEAAGIGGKANFGFPYTALNGNMYTFIDKAGVVAIRLAKADREAFLARYGTGLYQHESGAILKEYVTVPDSLLADTAALGPYLTLSYAYAQTLKPKPGKK